MAPTGATVAALECCLGYSVHGGVKAHDKVWFQQHLDVCKLLCAWCAAMKAGRTKAVLPASIGCVRGVQSLPHSLFTPSAPLSVGVCVCVLLPTLLPGVRVSLRAGQCLCSRALQLVRPSLSFNINSRVLPLLA